MNQQSILENASSIREIGVALLDKSITRKLAANLLNDRCNDIESFVSMRGITANLIHSLDAQAIHKGYQLTLEEWEEENELAIRTIFAETGQDREMDFDPESATEQMFNTPNRGAPIYHRIVWDIPLTYNN